MRRFLVLFSFAATLFLVAPLSGQPVQDVILRTSSTGTGPGVYLADYLQSLEPETVANLQTPVNGHSTTTVSQLAKLMEAAPVGTYGVVFFREEEVIRAVIIVE